MPNVQAMCASFKSQILSGIHALGPSVIRAATTQDTIMAALYFAGGTLGSATTNYSATGEVSGSGYSAGGIVVPNTSAPSTVGTFGIWTPSGSLVWNSVTISTSFDSVLFYNQSQGQAAISVHNFGPQTITNGTLTLSMPSNAPGTSLLGIN